MNSYIILNRIYRGMYCRSWATMEEYIKTVGPLWRNTLKHLGHYRGKSHDYSDNQLETPP